MARAEPLRALIVLAALAWGGTQVAADDLTVLAHPPAHAAGHPPLILLLHGVGADERDMIGLWPQLPLDFVVVSPRAPFRTASGGYRWYRTPATREADLAISRKIIDLLVEQSVKQFDADPGRVFLAGFSQGAVMVYEVALREPGRFRGAAVLSGSLFPAELAALPAGVDRTRESFFVAHGTADPVIGFSSATAATAALRRLGVPFDFHAYAGMRHTIGDAETRDVSAWLTARAAPDR